MRKRKTIRLRKTVFISCEGHMEKTFLSLIKELYSNDEYKVSIKNAKGGGPRNIIDMALQNCSMYDHVYCVLDSDVHIPQTLNQQAKKHKVLIIKSFPCIEGTLLDILDMDIPRVTRDCKREFEKVIQTGKQTEKEEHKKIFPKHLLDSKEDTVEPLRKMIKSMTGL